MGESIARYGVRPLMVLVDFEDVVIRNKMRRAELVSSPSFAGERGDLVFRGTDLGNYDQGWRFPP